jgi:hypothetical protein
MAIIVTGKLIYLCHPRTASNAVQRGLRDCKLKRNVEIHYPHHHIRLHEIPTDHDGRWLPHLTGTERVITTIRNPFDILVSYWLSRGMHDHKGPHDNPPKTFAT